MAKLTDKVPDMGGPAFPTTEYEYNEYADRPGSNPFVPNTRGGMTLRDYFAAKAMVAEMITSSSDATPEATAAFISKAAEMGHTAEGHLAFNAYLIADAMLAARKV